VTDVTVLTPSLNYGRFIEDAILSVLGQTGLTVQSVIQDGGSQDDTAEVLARYGNDIDWRSQPDEGQSDALNRALSRATGRWIAWLNADEFYLPGTLLELVREGERVGADVVYGDCVITDEAGHLVRLASQHRFSARVLKEFGCFISSSSVIFRRSVLGTDPWDVGVRWIMDWDLYMKLALGGAAFRHVRQPVGAFRTHPAQVTASPWRVWHEAPHEPTLLPAWQPERSRVGLRYGLPEDLAEDVRIFKRGRRLHGLYKLLEGSYIRERRAQALRGRDLRWFRSSESFMNAMELAQRCYGRSVVLSQELPG